MLDRTRNVCNKEKGVMNCVWNSLSRPTCIVILEVCVEVTQHVKNLIKGFVNVNDR
jgi:hypothetical protein